MQGRGLLVSQDDVGISVGVFGTQLPHDLEQKRGRDWDLAVSLVNCAGFAHGGSVSGFRPRLQQRQVSPASPRVRALSVPPETRARH